MKMGIRFIRNTAGVLSVAKPVKLPTKNGFARYLPANNHLFIAIIAIHALIKPPNYTYTCYMPYEITLADIKYADRYSCHLCRKSGAYCDETPLDCAIVASGREGLVIAANSYNGASTFKYWARKKINQSIVAYYREMYGKRRHVEYYKDLTFMPYHNNSIDLSRDGIKDRVVLKDLFNKRLSPGQKHRFHMRFIHGIPISQLANRDGISRDTMYVHFHNIKKRVREILEDV